MSTTLIDHFGQDITVKRDTNVEQRVKGKRIPDVYETLTMKASVQPMDSDETIEESPGAERNRDGIRLYTVEELKSVNVSGQLKADIVTYLGEDFEVVRVNRYILHNCNLPHYKSFALKVNEDLIK